MTRESGSDGAGDLDTLRLLLSRFQGVLILSMLMTQSSEEDEILRLATTAVSSLGGCAFDGIYTDAAGFRRPPGEQHVGQGAVKVAAIRALGPNGGELKRSDGRWGWAFPLRTFAEGHVGYMLVSAHTAPRSEEQFLLGVLVNETSVALANARLHARERATSEALRQSLAATERSMAVHKRLSSLAASGEGLDGLALAVHDLTGLPTAIEDEHGNVVSAAGLNDGLPPKASAAARRRLLRRLGAGPARDGNRLLLLANPQPDVMGVIALSDAEGRAGAHELVILEHAATVLSMELARLRSLAEAELRMGSDLVDELLAGRHTEGLWARAQGLGYDLNGSHRVALVEPAKDPGDSAFVHAIRQAVRRLGVEAMAVPRAGSVVVLAESAARWEELYTTMREAARTPVHVAVGSTCDSVDAIPRSYEEAGLVLNLLRNESASGGLLTFDELGVSQLLFRIDKIPELRAFVARWLGPLLEYDSGRSNAELVRTLAAFLGCGCSYDQTAAELFVHKSTTRYRLRRIREVTGYDLNDPEIVLNLQIATRVWRLLAAME
ncbi:MAG: PucR family transcriptional regulator [Acidimicrobiia bacterium]